MTSNKNKQKNSKISINRGHEQPGREFPGQQHSGHEQPGKETPPPDFDPDQEREID